MSENEIIEVRKLSKTFVVREGLYRKHPINAVDNVDFSLKKGETLALIGESGSGKSTVGRMILRLLEPSSGNVFYRHQPVSSFHRDKMLAYRKAVQAVFQDPYSSLNPRMTVGEIIAEPIRNFRLPGDSRGRVTELLERVGLDRGYIHRYPHQCSGGQKQRVAIARALAVEPEAVILDEPLTALDITVQTQIIALLKELQVLYGMSYLLITHDLRVVRAMADRVVVMYRGRVVEAANKAEFMQNPVHPHSTALLAAVPQLVVYKN